MNGKSSARQIVFHGETVDDHMDEALFQSNKVMVSSHILDPRIICLELPYWAQNPNKSGQSAGPARNSIWSFV